MSSRRPSVASVLASLGPAARLQALAQLRDQGVAVKGCGGAGGRRGRTGLISAASGDDRLTPKRRHKYGAIVTFVDGKRFDSKAEARRYIELKALALAGEIGGLELQPAFPIEINGVQLAVYRADFRYRDARTGQVVVEDVKSDGTRTALYRLKRKLAEALHPGTRIVEVMYGAQR